MPKSIRSVNTERRRAQHEYEQEDTNRVYGASEDSNEIWCLCTSILSLGISVAHRRTVASNTHDDAGANIPRVELYRAHVVNWFDVSQSNVSDMVDDHSKFRCCVRRDRQAA